MLWRKAAIGQHIRSHVSPNTAWSGPLARVVASPGPRSPGPRLHPSARCPAMIAPSIRYLCTPPRTKNICFNIGSDLWLHLRCATHFLSHLREGRNTLRKQAEQPKSDQSESPKSAWSGRHLVEIGPVTIERARIVAGIGQTLTEVGQTSAEIMQTWPDLGQVWPLGRHFRPKLPEVRRHRPNIGERRANFGRTRPKLIEARPTVAELGPHWPDPGRIWTSSQICSDRPR